MDKLMKSANEAPSKPKHIPLDEAEQEFVGERGGELNYLSDLAMMAFLRNDEVALAVVFARMMVWAFRAGREYETGDSIRAEGPMQ